MDSIQQLRAERNVVFADPESTLLERAYADQRVWRGLNEIAELEAMLHG